MQQMLYAFTLTLLAGIEGMEALNDAPPMAVKVLNVPDS